MFVSGAILKKVVLNASIRAALKFVVLKHFFYIQYLAQFEKNQVDTQALIDSKSNFNKVHSINNIKLRFYIKKIDVGIQKILPEYL